MANKSVLNCIFIYFVFFNLKKIFILYVHFIYLFIMYTIFLPVCLPAGQKRASDFISDGCEPPCGCWELNSGPLEEQAMLLIAEPSLQLHMFTFLSVSISVHHVHACACGGQKRALDLLELEFYIVVSHHVGAGN